MSSSFMEEVLTLNGEPTDMISREFNGIESVAEFKEDECGNYEIEKE